MNILTTLKHIAIGILLIALGAAGGFFYGKYIGHQLEAAKHQVSTTQIFEKFQEQAFLVTQTFFLEQDTSIVMDAGSNWNNLLWGQEITASGLTRVDVGVDLSNISEQNIQVDNKLQTVRINMPSVEVLDSSITGPLDIDTSNGLLRRIFDDADGEEYNMAMEILVEKSQNSLEENPELLTEAVMSTEKAFEMFVEQFGLEYVK
jgi:hypothetical protein